MANSVNENFQPSPKAQTTPKALRKPYHILDNFYIGSARHPDVLEIWGYTDRFSYQPGETIAFRVNTTATTWDIAIARDGATCDPVFSRENLPGIYHDTPQDCSVNGCNWPVAFEFIIPQDWRPGGYLVTFTGYCGDETVEEHHLFLLRCGTMQEPAPILMLCATATWVAYNCWGGSNAYEGITGEDGRQFSPILSIHRPWTRGFCKLPKGAPRALPEHPLKPNEMVRYPYMEWAYAYGYSKKYASAGWASYERHFMQWAEGAGYKVDCAAQHDLETVPDLLDKYQCLVIVGHDEYWSARMRCVVDQWVEAGGCVARFAGNFLWQIRMENTGSAQVCYKYTADSDDPVLGTEHQNLLTGAWESPKIDWPGAQTFGVNGLRGIYAGLGNCVGRGSGGFTIYRPEHWAFEGACLGYGDILGADARIFGYEVDGLEHVIKDGLPWVTGEDGADASIEILGLGLGTNSEANHNIWGETHYIGTSDAQWKAQTLYGAVTPETYDKSLRGNGVMISWARGKGRVFTAATCEWVMGLTRGDWQVEQVTKNVLDRFMCK